METAEELIAAIHDGPLPVGGVGRKAAALSRVAVLGIPTPRGVVIAHDAHRAWKAYSESGRDYLTHLSEAIVRSLREIFPDGTRLAVRSSSSDEDSATGSQAGRYLTVLDVEFSSAAIAGAIDSVYRSGSASNASMAVIVCEFIAADSSGVAFGADPISGDRSAVFIECTSGSAGIVNGDGREIHRWRIDPAVGQPSDQGILGGHLGRIVKLCQALEAVVDYDQGPVDMEWAVLGDTVYVLQARAIVLDESWTGRGEVVTSTEWSDANLRDSYPFVQSPLAWSLMRAVNEATLLSPFESVGYQPPRSFSANRLIEGRSYLNMTAMHYWFWDCFGISGEQLRSSIGGHEMLVDFSALLSASPLQRIAKFRRLVALVIASFRIRPVLEADWRSANGSAELSLEDWGRKASAVAAAAQLSNFAAGIMLGSLEALCRWLFKDEWLTAVTAIQDNRASLSVVMAEAFDAIAADPTVEEALGRADPTQIERAGSIEQFVARFGFHAPQDMDITVPRWSEDVPSLARFAMQRVSAGRGVERASPKSRRVRFLKLILGRVVSARVRAREHMKEQVIQLAAELRLVARRSGEALAERGIIHDIDSVFYLSAGELDLLCSEHLQPAAIDLLITQRREEREALAASAPQSVHSMGARDGTTAKPDVAVAAELGRTLLGIPGSEGVVKGPAWKAHSFEDVISAAPGTIIIAASADASWVPALAEKAGLVLESGGMLSHVAIACRELGIPAVMNVKNVMTSIMEGQLIQIDGRNGLVICQGDS